MNSPCPVSSRRNSAAHTPIAIASPVLMSPIAIDIICGAPCSSSLWLFAIRPE